MKMLSFALTLLVSQAALALGPIPNGEYHGSTTCQSAGAGSADIQDLRYLCYGFFKDE